MGNNFLKAVSILCVVFLFAFLYHTQRVSQLNTLSCKNCNVVLVSVDTLRAEDLPCYGYKKDTSPNLCRFGKNNIIFENHYSNSDSTLPGHFSIMTGLYPQSHGMLKILTDTLSPKIHTLAEEYQNAGYNTIFVGPEDDNNIPLDKGFERGFDDLIFNSIRGNPAWQKGLDRLDRNNEKSKPTFLFLHTYDVHSPYISKADTFRFTNLNYPKIPHTSDGYYKMDTNLWNVVIDDFKERLAQSTPGPDKQKIKTWLAKFETAKNLSEFTKVFNELPDDEKNGFFNKRYLETINVDDPKQIEFLKALYDEGVYDLDQGSLKNLFNFLKEKDLMKNTIVVVTSDHGERFMEHGKILHGGDLYNETSKVPLLMAIPGVKERKIGAMTQSIDIYPTLLNLTKIDPPNYLEGISLTRLIAGVSFPYKNEYQIGQGYNLKVESIQNGIWKLQVKKNQGNNVYELYNLVFDKEEKNNLYGKLPWVGSYLKHKMDSILSKGPNFPNITSPFPSWVDDVKRQKLEKEGYF